MSREDVLVSADEAGVRIDRYLTSVLGGQSRSQIQRLIKEGKVTIAGQSVPANRVVKTGDAIAIDIPEPVSAAVAGEYDSRSIYLIGGWSKNGPTQSVQVYDVPKATWLKVEKFIVEVW